MKAEEFFSNPKLINELNKVQEDFIKDVGDIVEFLTESDETPAEMQSLIKKFEDFQKVKYNK